MKKDKDKEVVADEAKEISQKPQEDTKTLQIALNEEERTFLAYSLFQVRSLVRAAKSINELEEVENMDICNLMMVAEDKVDKVLELFDEKSIT